MTPAAVGLLAALGCGLAGLGVPTVVAALPGPAGDVGARRGLRAWSVVLATGSGAVVGLALADDAALLVVLPLVPLAVALALVDAHAHLLPTRLIWPGLGAAVVLAAAATVLGGDAAAFGRAGLAGALVFAVLHALWWVRPDGVGYGDVRLSALVGFVLGYLGVRELVIGLYGALVAFALVGVAQALRRRQRAALREPLPFGPFLLGGVLLGVALAGDLLGRPVGHLVGG